MLVSGRLLVDVVGVRSRGEVLAHTLVNRGRGRGRVRVRVMAGALALTEP